MSTVEAEEALGRLLAGASKEPVIDAVLVREALLAANEHRDNLRVAVRDGDDLRRRAEAAERERNELHTEVERLREALRAGIAECDRKIAIYSDDGAGWLVPQHPIDAACQKTAEDIRAALSGKGES